MRCREGRGGKNVFCAAENNSWFCNDDFDFIDYFYCCDATLEFEINKLNYDIVYVAQASCKRFSFIY